MGQSAHLNGTKKKRRIFVAFSHNRPSVLCFFSSLVWTGLNHQGVIELRARSFFEQCGSQHMYCAIREGSSSVSERERERECAHVKTLREEDDKLYDHLVLGRWYCVYAPHDSCRMQVLSFPAEKRAPRHMTGYSVGYTILCMV